MDVQQQAARIVIIFKSISLILFFVTEYTSLFARVCHSQQQKTTIIGLLNQRHCLHISVRNS